MAGLRTIAGGEIKEYVKMLNDARNLAMERLREEAEKAGANAVIEMRFDTSEIAQIVNCPRLKPWACPVRDNARVD